MNAFLASIIAFFTSLFGLQSAPVPPATGHQPLTTASTPMPTPSYPRTTYINSALNYQLLHPTDTSLEENADATTAWDKKHTLRIDEFIGNSLQLEAILEHDLNCSADGPMGSISCKNTAVKPFTNQSGTKGFLIRRTKTITGLPNAGEYKDTAYVFPLSRSVVILSVESPTPQNLQVLTDTANWFTALP
jgi:hypothetical protein